LLFVIGPVKTVTVQLPSLKKIVRGRVGKEKVICVWKKKQSTTERKQTENDLLCAVKNLIVIGTVSQYRSGTGFVRRSIGKSYCLFFYFFTDNHVCRGGFARVFVSLTTAAAVWPGNARHPRIP